MENKGIIQKINGNKIEVKLFKDTACSHCSGCSEGNKFGKDFEFTTDLPANIGDIVTFEIESSKVMKAVGLAYIFPPVMMIVGYYLFSKLFHTTENMAIVGSFGGLFLAFVFLFFYDRLVIKKKENSDIRIISIKKDDRKESHDCCGH